METDNNVRDDIKAFMEVRQFSLNTLSRALGFSTATMSQWLAGKYPGRSDEIEVAVQSFLVRQRERNQSPKLVFQFIETTVSKKVFEFARLCHLDSEIGVVYGDAGLGKTDASREYTRQNPGVILIEANLGYTARVLFKKLHHKVGLDGTGSIADMFDDVVDRLKDSGRLIVVDEAEHLPYRALELLRRVYDKANVGILLVGMPRLIANLRGKRGEYAQLYSRVGVAVKLESLKPEDVESFVRSVLPKSNGLWKTYDKESNGNTRILTKLLRRSMRLAEINHIAIDAGVIQDAAKTLII